MIPVLEDKTLGKCVEIRQNSIEEFFEQDIGWDSEYLQLSPGPLNFATTFAELPEIELYWNRFGNRMRLREIYNGRCLMFGCVLEGSAPPVYRGRSFRRDHAFIYQIGIEHDFVIPDHCRSLIIQIEPSLVDLMGWTVDPAPAKPVTKGTLHALRCMPPCNQTGEGRRRQTRRTRRRLGVARPDTGASGCCSGTLAHGKKRCRLETAVGKPRLPYRAGYRKAVLT